MLRDQLEEFRAAVKYEIVNKEWIIYEVLVIIINNSCSSLINLMVL